MDDNVVVPENWDRMNFGEKWIWLLEKEEEMKNKKPNGEQKTPSA